MGIKEELVKIEFQSREYSQYHIPYDREMAFYQTIRNGDMEKMHSLFTPLCVEGFGKLSENRLRNLKYHLIITVAFITRYCIEGGLLMESAYNLSDIYIRKIDTCNSEEGVHSIHLELCEAYTKKMQALKVKKLYTKPITKCIDYIYENLHSEIFLDDLAEQAGLNPSYLSTLFHQEVGMTVAQYIVSKKIEAAKNLLIYTDYSTTEISNYMCFSSESYFIRLFKKETGYTPKQFRQIHFRAKLRDNSLED